MLSRWRNITISSALLLGAMTIIGCGEKPQETLPGHPVKGKVTVNGKEPGTYASIEFVSVANPSETGSAGLDPSGNFAGRVPLGKCKVAIKVGAGGGPPGGGGSGGGSSNPYGNSSKGGGPTGPPPGAGGSGGPGGGSGGPPLSKGAEIPKKFQDVKTSGIQVEVIDGQDVNIDFK